LNANQNIHLEVRRGKKGRNDEKAQREEDEMKIGVKFLVAEYIDVKEKNEK
jgi:hypothetical protein